MQGLLDSCIRNIYQAREVKDGLPIFQVGPTCYRGLWVVDGAFILEAMTFLGRGEEARAGIRHLLTRQKPDGSFEILAELLEGERDRPLYHDPARAPDRAISAGSGRTGTTVKRVVAVIQAAAEARAGKTRPRPKPGLMPPGFPDGGIGGVVPEYTNVYWNLAGLKAAVEAARLIRAPELADWEAEFKDFWAAFRSAAKRDAKPDRTTGCSYLPILMTPQNGIDPVRGQWGFCHAVYPGKLFAANDPLALGNMGLLDEHEKEGLVLGTGWMADGIWNYFGSFYGHAHLWLGHGEKAAEILLRVRQPRLAASGLARGAAAPRRKNAGAVRRRHAPQLGERRVHPADQEPASSSSAATNFTFSKGCRGHGSRPGAVTELREIATDFGPVSLRLEVAADGKEARLSVTPPRKRRLQRIVVHLGAWAAEEIKIIPPKRKGASKSPFPLVL